MTSVASLPEQSPGCRCRSLTGAGARTSAAGPLARLLPRRRLPPPHLPTRPPPGGWSRNQSHQRRGPGRCWGWGRGMSRICPLCPGAPEYINSAVSSQTLSQPCTPPQSPQPDPRPLSLRVGLALPGGGLGCGEAGSANRHWFSFLFPFIDFGWSPRAAAPGVAMNGWMPRALGPPGTTNKQPLSSREDKVSILLLNSVP
ncbi:putative uncharacterized protein FLJ36797 [Hylobates moloch]|uniref:putative uncharacterized protein FLJ36797 n=1 Tax=Hylobates moloch TaxID=81572 RepID=UPI0026756BCB|nr:putative uncharacterized protein FLJ36797 [Hylobates moloch]